MSRKKELIKIIEDARLELDVIETKEVAQKLGHYVGKFYKFGNSYGSPADGWWLYMEVTGLNADAEIEAFQFEQTCQGEVRIDTVVHLFDLEEYTEISQEEYQSAKDDFFKELKRMFRGRA